MNLNFKAKIQTENQKLTYKIVGDYNICNKVSTCLIRLCANATDAETKLNELLEKNEIDNTCEMIGKPYIIAEYDSGDEWYYGYTD